MIHQMSLSRQLKTMIIGESGAIKKYSLVQTTLAVLYQLWTYKYRTFYREAE